MSAHAYPKAAILADASRAGAGLVLSSAPLALADGPLWVVVPLALAAGVFALNGLATANRALSAVDAGEEAVRVRGPWPAQLRWEEVRGLRLAHYSTRRDGSGGWMQLTLAGGGRRLVVDSRIGGFELLVRRAVSAARLRSLRLDGATVANLRALGIEAEAPAPIQSPAQ